nr:unnamed protein product [Callosobruchus chinensis]
MSFSLCVDLSSSMY